MNYEAEDEEVREQIAGTLRQYGYAPTEANISMALPFFVAGCHYGLACARKVTQAAFNTANHTRPHVADAADEWPEEIG